jgi:hypothetical protein
MNYAMMHGSMNIKFTEQVRCGLVLFCGTLCFKRTSLENLGEYKNF